MAVTVFHPDPRLRQRTPEMHHKGHTKSVIEALVAAGDENLVGLSSVQIDEPGRIIIYRDSTLDGIWSVLVNPVIVRRSEEHSIDIEGCGSIPGVFVAVKRPVAIRVVHDRGTLDVTGHDARIIQHEIDHLDGILIVDYSNVI